MSTFQIKVCGITRPHDAALAASLGADMIGMIFYKGSPRHITLTAGKEITAVLPPTVDRVAVFVNEQADRVLRICDKLGCQYAQLHGRESASEIKKLKRSGLKVIKSFGIHSRGDWLRLDDCEADLLLVDSMTSTRPGGTGSQFDWRLKPARHIPNLMLAGGVSIANVEEGLRIFHPLVIDVNSSVETQPGIKSARRLKQLITLCNELRNGE